MVLLRIKVRRVLTRTFEINKLARQGRANETPRTSAGLIAILLLMDGKSVFIVLLLPSRVSMQCKVPSENFAHMCRYKGAFQPRMAAQLISNLKPESLRCYLSRHALIYVPKMTRM